MRATAAPGLPSPATQAAPGLPSPATQAAAGLPSPAAGEGPGVRARFEGDEQLGAPRKLMDSLTRPGENWFEHHKKFVDQGVELFKQDGSNQVLEHPDRKWANGMEDEEFHNLYPLVYSRQMHEGFRDHTGRRFTGFSASGYAGLQRYTGTWTGDTGGGAKPLAAMLNLGLSGHGLITCDMEVAQSEGIHFGFLQAWAQVNSWNYWRHPWLLGDELKPVFTFYARLRARLIPYLYSYAHQEHRTGLPILRAMPLEFPDDPEAVGLLTQYLLGHELLVSAFTEKVYLPAGEWVDYWTGERHAGPKWLEYAPPAGRGGGLFARAGALLPLTRHVADYVGQKPLEEMVLEVFPGAAGTFALVEDDGTTYAYETGAVAETRFEQHPGADGLTVRIGARQGEYDGMPARRTYRVQVRLPVPPRQVRLDGRPLPEGRPRGAGPRWWYDPRAGSAFIETAGDPGVPAEVRVVV